MLWKSFKGNIAQTDQHRTLAGKLLLENPTAPSRLRDHENRIEEAAGTILNVVKYRPHYGRGVRTAEEGFSLQLEVEGVPR